MAMTSSDALPEVPSAKDVQRALDAEEGRSMQEVLGVLTGQVPVKSMPVAMKGDSETDDEDERE